MTLPNKVFLAVFLLIVSLTACQTIQEASPVVPEAGPADGGYLPEFVLPAAQPYLSSLAIDNIIRINAGGPEVVIDGITWNQDAFYSDSRAYINTDITNVASTNKDELYLTERVSTDRGDSFTYSIPVSAPGTYEVRLHFAEIWVNAPGGGEGGVGSRVFDVSIEGSTVLSDYDVYAEVGAAAAVIEDFEVVVHGRVLEIELSAPANYPKISAIEVIPSDVLPSPQLPMDAIMIHPSDDANALVREHPAGTTFVFKRGVHRFTQPVHPRDGNSFIGEAGAVLSGAQILTEFSREGSLWVISGQRQQGNVRGSCRDDAPRCNYPEDLFIDDVPLKHVSKKSEVVPGAWFFDYSANKIYFADNPAGRTVEVSSTESAFRGGANDVTIKHLIIEKFASPAQHGAIHAYYGPPGENWHIEGNEVRFNHGVGIKVGYGAKILNNHVHQNGQLGIGSSGGVGTLIEGNEIAHNNFAGFKWRWEGGGTKFTNTEGLIVRNNHVHSNNGAGLWTDMNNLGTLYEYNVVENNFGDGIFHEVSYRATIRHNAVRNNGLECNTGFYCHNFGAGINIYNSPDVEVYENTVLGNFNGITARHDENRVGRSTLGPRSLVNLHVHNNTVEMLYHPEGTGPQGSEGMHGFTGIVGGAANPVFGRQANNRFENNTYYIENPNRHFSWASSVGWSFAQWQACNNLWPGCTQDKYGTATQGQAPEGY